MQVVTLCRDTWKENDKELLDILTSLSVKVSKLEAEVYKQKKLLEPTGVYVAPVGPVRRLDFEDAIELRSREERERIERGD